MSTRSVRRPLLLIAFAALAIATTVPLASVEAAPAGWTSPQRIPGTSGVANQVSATAPDGTDAVFWVAQAPDDQVAIRGRVRAPGSDKWVRVDSYVTVAAQNLAVAADRDGDFWLTWVRYNPNTSIPQVLLSRLDSDTAKLSTPQLPFNDEGYSHSFPRIAVADGGTVFVATNAAPKESSNPLTYRTEVGVKRPGEPWRTRFLSPVAAHAVLRSLAVSPNGHAVVAFIQGNLVAERQVWAATRPAGADSTWTVTPVSAPGDGHTANAAIGPDGMAAIEWNAPANGSGIVRMAFRDVTGEGAWTSTDIVSGTFNQVESPVVDPDGYITSFWWDGRVWARQVQDGAVLGANAVSSAGVRSDLRAVLMGNGGLAAVLHQSFDDNIDNLGLRLRWVDHGLAFEEQVLTMSSDGSVSSPQMGLDAADHVNLVWTAGDYPIIELRSMGNPPAAPSAVSAPHFGEPVTSATMTGRARVGRALTCGAGFVVEANEINWRWYRNGNRISGASGREYRLRDADEGKRVRCAMVARGLDASTTLTSAARMLG